MAVPSLLPRACTPPAYHQWWPPGYGAPDVDSECPSPCTALLESRPLTPTALCALSGQPQPTSNPEGCRCLAQHPWTTQRTSHHPIGCDYTSPMLSKSQPRRGTCPLTASFHGCCPSAFGYSLGFSLHLYSYSPVVVNKSLYKLLMFNLLRGFCFLVGAQLTQVGRRV